MTALVVVRVFVSRCLRTLMVRLRLRVLIFMVVYVRMMFILLIPCCRHCSRLMLVLAALRLMEFRLRLTRPAALLSVLAVLLR